MDERREQANGSAQAASAGAGTSSEGRHGRRNTLRGVVLTLVGGTCWGFSGTCAKFLMDGYAIDPVWLVWARHLGACGLFLAFACVANRDKVADLVRTRGGDASSRVLLVLTALSTMANALFYLLCVDATNSATATVLQTLALVLLMAFACVTARRLPHARESLGVVLALGGTVLLATGGNLTRLAIPELGLVFGLLCALTYALYSGLPAKILPRWGSPLINGVSMLVSGLVLTVAIRPWEHMPQLDAAGIGWLAIIIVVGTFCAYALYMQGVRDLGPLRASMLGTIEPVSATVFSALWLGTTFTPFDITGFAMIILMVYLTA